MVTVERFLMVHEGKLYELRTDGDASSCVFHSRHNGGPCPGCASDDYFPKACRNIAHVLGTVMRHWKELSV